MADRRDDRHRARRDGAYDALVAEREQVVEAAAAARQHDDVDLGPRRTASSAATMPAAARSPLDERFRDEDARRREAGWIVVRTSRFAAASLPVTSADAARQQRQPPLAGRVE